jgi:hypothetical protein
MTAQTGSTPNRSLCESMNPTSADVWGRVPGRNKHSPPSGSHPPQFADLTLQLGDLLLIIARRAGTLTGIGLRFLHPVAESLGVHTQPLADPCDRATRVTQGCGRSQIARPIAVMGLAGFREAQRRPAAAEVNPASRKIAMAVLRADAMTWADEPLCVLIERDVTDMVHGFDIPVAAGGAGDDLGGGAELRGPAGQEFAFGRDQHRPFPASPCPSRRRTTSQPPSCRSTTPPTSLTSTG